MDGNYNHRPRSQEVIDYLDKLIPALKGSE